jgi:betaine-aldehyde dehydrogenase
MAVIDVNRPFDIKHPDRFLIGGTWVEPSTANKIELVCPNTEEIFMRVAEAREVDVERAVLAARAAFDRGPWPRMSHAERAAKMRELAGQLLSRSSEIAYVYTEQMGVLPALAQTAAGSAAEFLNYYAGLAATYKWEEERVPADRNGVALVVSEPVGVVAVITPWNGTLQGLTQKLAPALIAGCTAVLKPAPETPLEAYILAECVQAAGFPPGVINMLCANREVSDYLVRQPGIDKVSFTGSTAAGRRIAAVCGERIARVGLELGGKSAAIVLDDVDPAAVARTLTASTCLLSGQACAALTRVLVSNERKNAIVDALAEGFRAVRIGHSRDPATQLGPLAMKRQLDRVEGYIAAGLREGAKLVTGGKRPRHLPSGYFIEPTLFANVDNSARIAQEEIFGPVVSVIGYEGEAQAIRIANDSIYGLNGAVFTHDTERAYRIMRQVRTGMMAQNKFKFDSSLPFGGFKQSGVGREYGIEGLQPYLELKTLHLDRRPTGRL